MYEDQEQPPRPPALGALIPQPPASMRLDAPGMMGYVAIGIGALFILSALTTARKRRY